MSTFKVDAVGTSLASTLRVDADDRLLASTSVDFDALKEK
jgi:hypothetical protein